jgi:segregation and condensation protein B
MSDSELDTTEPNGETEVQGVVIPEEALRLAEAMVFAAGAPVTARALSQLLPDDLEIEPVMAALAARYAGRGVELVEAAGGWQFRTAEDLGPRLRRVIHVPRRLPRAAMETLSIVAYHQPVTRPEIEEIRGASLSQQTLDTLLETGLIQPRGRKEVPGRPTLWGTTPVFLAQFGLKDLRDLPRREDLLVEPPSPSGAKVEPAPEEPADEEGASGPAEPGTDADAARLMRPPSFI